MSRTIVFRNRQRARKLNSRALRKIIEPFLASMHGLREYELGIHLIGCEEMQRLNETYLGHQGSTDVITFDYNDPAGAHRLSGEIFICIPEAINQSRRFHVTWQSEVVRYIVHGVLHLSGFDDRAPKDRKRMKRQEDRMMRELDRRFDLDGIGEESPDQKRNRKPRDLRVSS